MPALTFPDGQTIAYAILGHDEPVLLLHGYLKMSGAARWTVCCASPNRTPPIPHPTLILWGEEDSLFPATGHAPNWERPIETAQALLTFWSEQK